MVCSTDSVVCCHLWRAAKPGSVTVNTPQSRWHTLLVVFMAQDSIIQSWINLWVASFEQIKHLPSLSISTLPYSITFATLPSYAPRLLVFSSMSWDFQQNLIWENLKNVQSSVNNIKHKVHNRTLGFADVIKLQIKFGLQQNFCLYCSYNLATKQPVTI